MAMRTTTKKSSFSETTMALLMLLLMMPATLTFGQEFIHFRQDTDTHHPQKTMAHPRHPERGYVENCGPGGGFFDISWNPKDISPADRIEFFTNFTSPIDMEAVHMVGELFYEGSHMLSIDSWYRCEDLAQRFVDFFGHKMNVKCPIRKGEQLTGSFVFSGTTQLIGYDGDYELKATMKNTHGNGMMCIRIKMTVLPFDY